jgi:cation:H+ antiporter
VSAAVLSLLAGLVLLGVGAEGLVRGASRLAGRLRVPPLLIGLTIVAYGTSAPETAVSAAGALAGRGDLVLGNALGSNVFNGLAILGAAALVAPLAAQARIVRIDAPLVVAATLAVAALAWDGRLGRLDGSLLLVAGLAYTALIARAGLRAARADARHEAPASDAAERPTGGAAAVDVAAVVVGLALLVAGSRLLVDGAVTIARGAGLSELVIGLTVVAAGTSLPELGTSILAAARGQRDVALGNLVGSNLFNLLIVLGVGGTLAPGGLPVPSGVATIDLPIALGVALVCLPVAFTGARIARWEGAVLLGFYLAYLAWLLADASGHAQADDLAAALVGFVVPLGAVAFVTLAIRERRRRGGKDARR